MAILIGAYMPLAKLREIVQTLEGRDEKGFKMTISVNDESNEYGQNVSLFAEQSKEQREAKADRYFCGNGKVFWTNGKIELATKVEKQTHHTPSDSELNSASNNDDLPF